MRLAWGWESYLSGYGHLHNVSGMVDVFRELHVPVPVFSVYVSAITEVVGGILLIVGFATRIVALPMAFNFLVAILTAGSDEWKQALFGGDHFKKYDAGHLGGLNALIDDTAFPFLMLSLLVLAFGPGRFSADYVLGRTAFRRHRPDDPSDRGFAVESAVSPVETRRVEAP